MNPPNLPWRSTHLARPGGSVESVLDECLGIYSTQPTGHLELLARVDGYRLGDLHRVVEHDRTAVRLRSLRGSAFVIPTVLLPVTQGATRHRNARSTAGFVKGNLQPGEYETWSDRVEALLADGPLASSDIRARLDPPEEIARMIRYVVALMAAENRIVAATVTGTWRSDRTTWARWEDWLPGVDVWSLQRDEAQDRLARLYLDRHGPATVEDFSFWSGLTKTQSGKALEAVAEPVAGTPYWASTPPEQAEPPPLRLLPIWDTLFVTYRDRSRFVAAEHYPLVYDASGNATSVVLVDGWAAGVWDLGGRDDVIEIKVAPFDDFTAPQWAAVEDEAWRIANLIGAGDVAITRCADPVDLSTAPRNRFMSPLEGC